MSENNQNVSVSSATEEAIASTTTVEPQPSGENIFVLMAKMEALLKDQSNRTVLKLMNAVGSMHGVRCIPVDRPIGQSTMGTTRVAPVVKQKKGQGPAPPAAWKQSPEYIQLSAQRSAIVATIKNLPDSDPNKESEIASLRETEQKLKALKGLRSGDH